MTPLHVALAALLSFPLGVHDSPGDDHVGHRSRAEITVNTLDGDDDGMCEDSPAGDCSLLEAVDVANADGGFDLISFAVSGTIFLTRTLVIRETVEIDGFTAPGGPRSVFLDGSGFDGPVILIDDVDISDGEPTIVRDLIIGNGRGTGIELTATATRVQLLDNSIGVTPEGANVGNMGDGVRIFGPQNLIKRSTIGFNTNGVWIQGDAAEGNEVISSLIGTMEDGRDVGNRADGIVMLDAPEGRIGGPSAGNTIGHNGRSGVHLWMPGTFGVIVFGNYIGTDEEGRDLGNGNDDENDGHGVKIVSSGANEIGGVGVEDGNTIGFNTRDGVLIFLDLNATPTGDFDPLEGSGNRILGNHIGTDAEGRNLGNGDDGVTIQDPRRNIVGGVEPGAGNTIRFNVDDGVNVAAPRAEDRGLRTVDNAVLGNNISDNGGIGINLQPLADIQNPNPGPPPPDVTPNDPGDLDDGANSDSQSQNYPEILGVTEENGTLRVSVRLDSRPTAVFRIEVFASEAVDPTGFGEGGRYLGASTVGTDGNGFAEGTIVVPAAGAGLVISTTATRLDAALPSGHSGTSEFSEAFFRSNVADADGPARDGSLSVFPNPSSGTATVTLDAAVGDDVRVTVYDLLGREVAVLFDGPASGDIRVALLAGRLAPGAYLIRALVRGETLTSPLTISR